jgi:hypothetical protein
VLPPTFIFPPRLPFRVHKPTPHLAQRLLRSPSSGEAAGRKREGWHELRYQDEEADLCEAIEKTLRIIRERDGGKYFKEVAANLIDAIAVNVSLHAGPLRRKIEREMIRQSRSSAE